MSWYLQEPRSDNYYDEMECGEATPLTWSNVLWFPVHLIVGVCVFFILSLLYPITLIVYFIVSFIQDVISTARKTARSGELAYPFLFSLGWVGFAGIIFWSVAYVVNPRLPPTGLVLMSCFVFVFTILPTLALLFYRLTHVYQWIAATREKVKSPEKITWSFLAKIYPKVMNKIKNVRPSIIVFTGILIAFILVRAYFYRRTSPPQISYTSEPTLTSQEAPAVVYPSISRSVDIMVDDFDQQPYQGDEIYFYNRLDGDRGSINDAIVQWGIGQVTTTISTGNSWAGMWMSLNHPIREDLPIDFSAILPAPISPAYQSQITGISVQIVDGTPGGAFRLELKNGNELFWSSEIILQGGTQSVSFDLPPLRMINQLVWVLDRASPGDFATLDSISFTATTSTVDTAMAAFVWSYGMLLNNWNPTTGLVRDKARDASGEFDAIQATGCLAAATAMAEQLGVIDHEAAIQIVNQISDTLLRKLPRFHGLWPHWVKVSPAEEISILENTEWSSVDTAISAIGLLTAQSGLGLDTSETERMLQAIEWNTLVTSNGISHGYTYSGDLIPYTWDSFGGESWLVELAYAAATGQIAPLAYASPPTANGSGFIDELAWLFAPPPTGNDYWGVDWASYRATAARNQETYHQSHSPNSCVVKLGLFGLSAAEVPLPSNMLKDDIYQAFGIGGRFAPANTSQSGLVIEPVVAPHYSAMIASLNPEVSTQMWTWLIEAGYFSPLNNMESLAFSEDALCEPTSMQWNQLKGSWNLSLQTLGWGRYLAERSGQVPVLWQAVDRNSFLQKGYELLTPYEIETNLASPQAKWSVSFECEYPDESITGQMIWRSEASELKVHGQFGGGYVLYTDINIPSLDQLVLKLRYSKYSSSTVPILIYLDNEPTPRASFYPIDQGDWNTFAWTEALPLGMVKQGVHTLKFYADGQQYGVADLDQVILEEGIPLTQIPPMLTPIAAKTTASTPANSFERECEYPDEYTVGQLISRLNASASFVHGQFGATDESPWPAMSGEVVYENIHIPHTDQWVLSLRYSKYSSAGVPIWIYIDDESSPRNALYPIDQGSWDNFVWSDAILLGMIESGIHSIRFYTDGQQYGVADLDMFTITQQLEPTPDLNAYPYNPTPYVPMLRNPGP